MLQVCPYISTDESHRDGTALLEACEQWAREQGYTLLSLTTGAANTALRF